VEAPASRPRRRPRLTGRAGVLLVVVAVLMISYASSLRAYLTQRDHITELKLEIAAREAAIADLEEERERWEDPAYTRQQARARFNYVMPGEKSFVVVDEDGEPVSGEASLDDPEDVVPVEPTAWWETAWASVRLAGNPPRERPQEETVPLDLIGPEDEE
jgi:cell division protein FtsB